MASESPVWLVSASAQSVRVRCRVQPRASRNAFAGVLGDALKVALTAPPVDGKANAALEAFWAERCGVAKSMVTVVSGQTSRSKTVEIAGVSLDEVVAAAETQCGRN